MNNLIGLGVMSLGMKGYQKILRTQKITVKYANRYRLRLQCNRWKNRYILAYLEKELSKGKNISVVQGSEVLGTLLFVFEKESFTQEEFTAFLNYVVRQTDLAYEYAPVTLLNRIYEQKIRADGLLKHATLGLVDVDTAFFLYTVIQGTRLMKSTPQTALGFLWWSYTILERSNRKRVAN
ncbi:HMA2 domain-containing protein [Liquorilactobacillus sucicola]|nr:hypothetical protein [Liquorilactobacillus sucicola]